MLQHYTSPRSYEKLIWFFWSSYLLLSETKPEPQTEFQPENDARHQQGNYAYLSDRLVHYGLPAVYPMNIEEYREYCIAKKGVTESFPFDADTLVFKVGGKMFALTNLSDFDGGIALKCDPVRATQLREDFPDDILGAYHMNKKHWNNVKPNGSVPAILLKELIDQSYLLVYNSLTRSQRTDVDNDNQPMNGLVK